MNLNAEKKAVRIWFEEYMDSLEMERALTPPPQTNHTGQNKCQIHIRIKTFRTNKEKEQQR